MNIKRLLCVLLGLPIYIIIAAIVVPLAVILYVVLTLVALIEYGLTGDSDGLKHLYGMS